MLALEKPKLAISAYSSNEKQIRREILRFLILFFLALLIFSCNKQAEMTSSYVSQNTGNKNPNSNDKIPKAPESKKSDVKTQDANSNTIVPSSVINEVAFSEPEETLNPNPIEDPIPTSGPTPDPIPDPIPDPEPNPILNKTFLLDSLQPVTQLFSQSKSKSQSRSFQQESVGQADILLVVDNSGSMIEEQINLATKLMPLLSNISSSDWRIGIISTDPADNCVRKVISKGDADMENQFRSAVLSLGSKGTGHEQGYRQAVTGLNCGSWVRQNSMVGVVFISDEDNCSNSKAIKNNHPCFNKPFRVRSYLKDFLTNSIGRTLGENAIVYGLIWKPGDLACKNIAYAEGVSYNNLINQTKGTVGSICAADYGPTLTNISIDLSNKMKQQFSLGLIENETILENSLVVNINGVLQNDGFQLNGNSLDFTKIPSAGSTISIEFDVANSSELIPSFSLSNSPVDSKVQVFVNGKLTPDKNYSVTGEKVEFSQIPPVNSEIKMEFQVAPTLSSKFAMNKNMDITEITIDGNPINVFSYDAATGTLTLHESDLVIGGKVVVNFQNRI